MVSWTRGIRLLPTTERYEPVPFLRGALLAVLMDKPPEKVGSIYLPDDVEYGDDETSGNTQSRLRADTGYVINSQIPSLWEGDRVAVSSSVGVWIDDVVTGRQIRFYGLDAVDMEPTLEDWDKQVRLILGEPLVPSGRNYLILRDALPEKKGSIILRDETKLRPPSGIILACGEESSKAEIGQRWIHATLGLTFPLWLGDPGSCEVLMAQLGLEKRQMKDVALLHEEWLLSEVV